MKMMLKSYLTGPDQVPDERVREMVLEEHLECGCACDEFAPYQCLGKFNKTTCQCDCTPEDFGQVNIEGNVEIRKNKTEVTSVKLELRICD